MSSFTNPRAEGVWTGGVSNAVEVGGAQVDRLLRTPVAARFLALAAAISLNDVACVVETPI